MEMAADMHLTGLLQRWSAGEVEAAETALPLVYDELHRLAAAHFRVEEPGHTLQATALVSEAYLRLGEARGLSWGNRAQFFAFCSHLFRRILVDHARRRRCLRRGGGTRRVTLSEAATVNISSTPDLVALDEALRELKALDSVKASIVELRFFGGLTLAEVAEHLGLSRATVWREWQRARIWLLRELEGSED